MSHCGKFAEISSHVPGLSLQTIDRILNRMHCVWRELANGGEQILLVTRVDHDISTLHEMVQPRTVVQRIHTTPSVQKNNHWRGARLRRIRFEDPILLPALAVTVFCDTCMRGLFAARTSLRLRRWSRGLEGDDAEGEKGEH